MIFKSFAAGYEHFIFLEPKQKIFERVWRPSLHGERQELTADPNINCVLVLSETPYMRVHLVKMFV